MPSLQKARQRMEGALEALRREFSSVRTGKASPALLDIVRVEAYGSRVPLNQVGTVSAPEPRSADAPPAASLDPTFPGGVPSTAPPALPGDTAFPTAPVYPTSPASPTTVSVPQPPTGRPADPTPRTTRDRARRRSSSAATCRSSPGR